MQVSCTAGRQTLRDAARGRTRPLDRNGQTPCRGTRSERSAASARSSAPLRLRAGVETSEGAGRRLWPPWDGAPTWPSPPRRPPSNQDGGAEGACRMATTAAAARVSTHHPVPRVATTVVAQEMAPSESRSSGFITVSTMAASTCACTVGARRKEAWGRGCNAVKARRCAQCRPARSTGCPGCRRQRRASCPLPLPPFPSASAAATMPLAEATGVGMGRVGWGAAGMEEEEDGKKGREREGVRGIETK